MPKRATIKSIAQDLGISHMTVSRALSDNPNVQKQTREVVRKRARELGYIRSAAAGAMRGDASSIIGLIIPNITNDFYAHFANQMAEACEAHGLQLIIHLTKDVYQAERLAINKLREIQARAIAMVPTPVTDAAAVEEDPSIDIIQLIRQRDTGTAMPAVLVDDTKAIRDAITHLRANGHDRIAYLGAPQTLSSGHARYRAYRQGLLDAGLAEDKALVFTAPPSLEMGESCAQKIIKDTDATALMCGGFEISYGALKCCIEQKVLNERIAFVGYGDPDFYSWIQGGVTTIKVPVEALAIKTVELVTDGAQPNRDQNYKFEAKFIAR